MTNTYAVEYDDKTKTMYIESNYDSVTLNLEAVFEIARVIKDRIPNIDALIKKDKLDKLYDKITEKEAELEKLYDKITEKEAELEKLLDEKHKLEHS